jgi:hypothetical protein
VGVVGVDFGTLQGSGGVTKPIASRTCQERQAIEGDSPVGESERPPLSTKAKYSWRPIVNEYREGKVKSTPEGE